MLFLTLLHVAQLALVIVVVVFAIRDIKKGSTHRVLMGSLIALVVLVVITPVLTHATIKEGMKIQKRKEKPVRKVAKVLVKKDTPKQRFKKFVPTPNSMWYSYQSDDEINFTG